MQRLLAFIEHNLHLILFAVLQFFCILLMFKFNPYQRAYFTNSAAFLTANVNSVSTEVFNYFGLKQQNILLQSSIIDSAYKNPYIGMHLFGDTFNVKDSNNKVLFDIVAAQVIFNTVHKANNVFVINKGSEQGIVKGSGVLSSTGVAGIITAVGPNFSTAMSLLSTEFKLVPQINKQEYFTDIIWDNTNPYSLKINKINKLEKIEEGDPVTTGHSSLIFPAGIPIGYISKLTPIKGSQYLDTEIKTATNFRQLNYVFILNNIYRDQIEELLSDE